MTNDVTPSADILGKGQRVRAPVEVIKCGGIDIRRLAHERRQTGSAGLDRPAKTATSSFLARLRAMPSPTISAALGDESSASSLDRRSKAFPRRSAASRCGVPCATSALMRGAS